MPMLFQKCVEKRKRNPVVRYIWQDRAGNGPVMESPRGKHFLESNYYP